MRRSELPEPPADPATWPGVDASALDAGRRADDLRREQAVRAWLAGSSLAEIEKSLGVDRGTLRRLIERCLMPHTDGRIQGLRALIPHSRTRPYRRTISSLRRAEPGGRSGAMGQLFERLPQLVRIVEREIVGGRVSLSANDRLQRLGALHDKLLAACREAGLTVRDYPLNQEGGGYRSLAVWVRRRLQARVPPLPLSRADAWAVTTRPFSVVELDGHKLDLRVRVRFVDASGIGVDLESERLFVRRGRHRRVHPRGAGLAAGARARVRPPRRAGRHAGRAAPAPGTPGISEPGPRLPVRRRLRRRRAKTRPQILLTKQKFKSDRMKENRQPVRSIDL